MKKSTLKKVDPLPSNIHDHLLDRIEYVITFVANQFKSEKLHIEIEKVSMLENFTDGNATHTMYLDSVPDEDITIPLSWISDSNFESKAIKMSEKYWSKRDKEIEKEKLESERIDKIKEKLKTKLSALDLTKEELDILGLVK